MAKKQQHPDFVRYMHFIAKHENYQGMPDLYKDDGEIQWEAPSNRLGGKYKFSHQKRLEWWQKKASEIGINPSTNQWISKTAKAIHPNKQKPCSVCGRVMDLRYAYPSKILIQRLTKLDYIDNDFEFSPIEHIHDLLIRLFDMYGSKIFEDLPYILRASEMQIPEIEPELKNWLKWIEDVYIPSEPSVLSPGAMSNAPDRLDGFHTYNRCCRPKEDTGRTPENLRTYTTDRRVFEYWNHGDWIAADRLMGQIRSAFRDEQCLNGHSGPCSADHIGPLSLGFNHRPEFQLLCNSCNSAKNNRMFYSDVQHLRRIEESGIDVISWHSKSLWDKRKKDVVDEETALRLSKLLRDNRHNVLNILKSIADRGFFAFLLTQLELGYSDYDVEFINLRIENHKTVYDREVRTKRETKYAIEQKARRCRVAFKFLLAYFNIANRNTFVIDTPEIKARIFSALEILSKTPKEIKELDNKIQSILSVEDQAEVDIMFRDLVGATENPNALPKEFELAKIELSEAMESVATIISTMWNADRYVRASQDNSG